MLALLTPAYYEYAKEIEYFGMTQAVQGWTINCAR
jgi:hypothetical protein